MRIAMLALALASPAIVYLLARLIVVYPALISEALTPFEALRRTVRMTSGHGWKIAGLILMAAMLYIFVQLALGSAFGAIFVLLGRLLGLEGVGSLLAVMFTAGLGAVANLVFTVGIGFLYRALAR